MIRLTFNALRAANLFRLPQFKNSKGAPAHRRADGADWNPAQWLQAMVGEVGEYARVRHQYERGIISHEEFAAKAAKELADVQVYLDLLSARALDKVDEGAFLPFDSAQIFQEVVALLGEYANERKKFDRGDKNASEFNRCREALLPQAELLVRVLRGIDEQAPNAPVTEPHPEGIDLGVATVAKFNEVSVRVGSTVRLSEHTVVAPVTMIVPEVVDAEPRAQ